MRVLFILILVSFIACSSSQQNVVTTFILVRHAEKGNDGTEDPDLKPEGVERSRRLSEILANTKLDAIYSTNYKRTLNTVQLIGDEKGLSITLYEPFKAEQIENILKMYEGGTVLITGHSDNIPWIVNLLTGKEEYEKFADEEYGNILVVSVVQKGVNAKVLRLSY